MLPLMQSLSMFEQSTSTMKNKVEGHLKRKKYGICMCLFVPDYNKVDVQFVCEELSFL
jgi:hypothetical protein